MQYSLSRVPNKVKPLVLLQNGNRHGLIVGATGTGKTVNYAKWRKRSSDDGAPVFLG